MAIITSKVTYSLKPETVDRVQELAAAWGVPKSEVIRRAIDEISVDAPRSSRRETPLDIFLRIRKENRGVSAKAAAKFNDEIRRTRRESDRRRQ